LVLEKLLKTELRQACGLSVLLKLTLNVHTPLFHGGTLIVLHDFHLKPTLILSNAAVHALDVALVCSFFTLGAALVLRQGKVGVG
jgi:hypothetical protein